MTKPKTYAEKLRDPRWQKKRLEIMQRDQFTCQHCQDKTGTLNVHHAVYVKGCEPWEYPTYMLITVCEPCHEKIEHVKARILLNAADCIPMWKFLTQIETGDPQMAILFQQWHQATMDESDEGIDDLKDATFEIIGFFMSRYHAAMLKSGGLKEIVTSINE